MIIYLMMILLIFVIQGINLLFLFYYFFLNLNNNYRGLDLVGSTEQLKQRLIDCEKTTTNVIYFIKYFFILKILKIILIFIYRILII